MSEVKIKVSDNQDSRAYEAEGLGSLLKPGVRIETFHPLSDESRTPKEVTLLGGKIAKYLKRIPGITKIFFVDLNHNRDIQIVKGTAFDWEDIEPQVVNILEVLSDNPDVECSFENKKVSLRCKVQSYPNDCVRGYHFNRFISKNFWCTHGSYYANSFELELPIRVIVEEIKKNPMIVGISLDNYSISIEKNYCSDWREIDKFLKPIFDKFFDASTVIECPQEDVLISMFVMAGAPKELAESIIKDPEMEQIVSLLRDALKESRDSLKIGK